MVYSGSIPFLDPKTTLPNPVDIGSSSADTSDFTITGRGRGHDDRTEGISDDGVILHPDDVGSAEVGNDSYNDELAGLVSDLETRLSQSHDSLSSISDYIKTLANALQLMQDSFKGLSDKDSFVMAEKIMDNIYNFALTSFTNDYNQQMWYLQQKYNTPLQQLQRLAEAGLNSAFITGDMNSGNAGSSAASASPLPSQNSGVGQLMAQEQANKTAKWNAGLQGAAALLGAVGGIGSSLGSVLTGVANFKTMQDVNPSVVALNRSNELVNNISGAKALQDMDNMQLVQLDNQYKAETEAARDEVLAANQARDTTAKYAFSDVTETKYEVHVKDSSNRTHTKVMTIDELNAAVANGNRTSDGERLCDKEGNFISGETSVSVNAGKKASKSRDNSSVSSVDNRSTSHYQDHITGNSNDMTLGEGSSVTDAHGEGSSVTDALGLALGFSLEGGASQKASYGSNGSHSKEISSEFSYTSDTSGGLSKSSGFDYDEEGNVRIGNTTYHAVTTHTKVLNSKYKDEWNRRLQRCQEAADHYSSLTRGEKYKFYTELHTMARDAYNYKRNVMLNQFYRQLFR